MKLAEVEQKYKGYKIVEKGYIDSIPFTCLPNNYENLDIKGIDVVERKIKEIDVTSAIFGGKKKPNKTYKGIVTVWYK